MKILQNICAQRKYKIKAGKRYILIQIKKQLNDESSEDEIIFYNNFG